MNPTSPHIPALGATSFFLVGPSLTPDLAVARKAVIALTSKERL